ncbi:hypothetical protein EZS27_007727 [termite gut metagenome]|uniref:Tail specific protease domain-containing protein n=1 Tax=termite gut metagenome TaxID=433724 RepID=A0A5J4SHA2_9ZZZZ
MTLDSYKIMNVNTKKIIIGTFLYLILSVSCGGEDRRKEYTEITEVPHWIESVMREHYYWYENIPTQGLNFFAEPDVFFNSLLSNEDGKRRNGKQYYYSTLKDLSKTANTRSLQQPEYSYGFDFVLYKLENTGSTTARYAALILYVVPNSPAERAELKRGMWILDVNGKTITEANYNLLSGGEAAELSIGIWLENGISSLGVYPIEAACEIEDNPVHYYNIYKAPDNGKRIGYLVYNHFTAGKTENDKTYNGDLLEVSNIFKNEGVNECILDLRYNNGGLLTSAQLLCSILAPQSALGKSAGYLEFNDKYNPQIEAITLNPNNLQGGANLNLTTLYVITGEATASASEMLINTLSPYMNVILIGTKTEGKNVGSITFKDDKYTWELHPIVCKIYNSENNSDYANGFIPDYLIEENKGTNLDRFLELGDPNELLLNAALNIINETYQENGQEAVSRLSLWEMTPIHCSLERRATNGVIVR